MFPLSLNFHFILRSGAISPIPGSSFSIYYFHRFLGYFEVVEGGLFRHYSTFHVISKVFYFGFAYVFRKVPVIFSGLYFRIRCGPRKQQQKGSIQILSPLSFESFVLWGIPGQFLACFRPSDYDIVNFEIVLASHSGRFTFLAVSFRFRSFVHSFGKLWYHQRMVPFKEDVYECLHWNFFRHIA